MPKLATPTAQSEATLLAQGYVFAQRVTYQCGGKTYTMMLCARRPLADCARDMFLDAAKVSIRKIVAAG